MAANMFKGFWFGHQRYAVYSFQVSKFCTEFSSVKAVPQTVSST